MELYAIFLVLTPPLITCGGLWLLRLFQKRKSMRSPITGKVCRFPGYTLSKEIKVLDEDLLVYFMMLFILPSVIIGMLGVRGITFPSLFGWIVFIGMFVAVVGYCVVNVFKTIVKLKAMRRGLVGEQVVGHHLSALIREGFYVFHDLDLGNENIDHIAVGPPGVFTIETKYRSKKNITGGHKVLFNGESLKFGGIEITDPVNQAKRQAEKLSEDLRNMFGVTVRKPVLVYPGWLVTREKTDLEVCVLNDKELSGLARFSKKLDQSQVSKIAAYFEKNCRDLEI